MMNLAEFRRTSSRLADYLPWVALVAPGVVLNKDGSFQRTAKFRGPDLDSGVAAELVAVASRINNAFRRLGSGWTIFVEAVRLAAQQYPESTFPDPASALVDAERQADFEEVGAHFESQYFLTFLSLPPAEEAARTEAWLYEGRERSGVDPHEVLRAFLDRTERVLALLDGFMPECGWLDDAETLTYLHSTISTKRHRVRVPETPVYLDALLADQSLTGGLEPRLGDQHLRMLTIVGFPTSTTPGLLDDLNRLAFPYRWSTRAILLDKPDATRLLTKIRRQWFANPEKGAGVYRVRWRKDGRSLGPRLSFRRPTLQVNPSRVRRGGFVRVHGGVFACQGPVTLLSGAFSRRHQFAGVPAISAPVGSHGAYSVRTRIPAARPPGLYTISGRCGGGNLGVQARLRVRP